MSAPTEPAPRPTTLLTVQAGGGCWAIPSAAVTNVERLTAGSPSDAPDALGLLGLTPLGEEAARRIVVVRAAGEQARILVSGDIALVEAAPSELLPLPRELRTAAPLVSHVAVLSGRPALFVVSPERLLRAARDTALFNDTDADRGTSC
ncbi:MAG: hypothetical protein K0R38_1375 [Polyangiaceae bacterium]|jgi:hypothetical protein|nr:hypothetical protein [Polyangiaceae bacterium]